jgi:hypothetical protein
MSDLTRLARASNQHWRGMGMIAFAGERANAVLGSSVEGSTGCVDVVGVMWVLDVEYECRRAAAG